MKNTIKDFSQYLQKHGNLNPETVIRYSIPVVRIGGKFVTDKEKHEGKDPRQMQQPKDIRHTPLQTKDTKTDS